MQNFIFNNPIKMIFGAGELDKIGIEAKALGKKAMIVTGKGSSSKYNILSRVLDYLKKENVEAVVFDKVEPNPRTTTIDNAAQIARDNNCDLIIGLGGGSPMDAAKAIALGADGVVIGTAELVALECVRCGNCESGRGCARGIATTDSELGGMITEEYAEQRIVNMYMAWRKEWCELLRQLGMKSVKELVGRSDLLVHLDYLEEEERRNYQEAPQEQLII